MTAAALDAGDLAQLRRTAAGLLGRGGLARIRALRGADPGFERSLWAEMAAQGWCGLRVPEAQGGLALDPAAALALVEELARGLAPEPFVACALQAAETLTACPPSALRDRLLAGIADGSLILATSPQDGSALQAAEVPGGGLRLSGRLGHLAPGRGADMLLLPAGSGAGAVLACLTPAQAGPGLAPRLNADGSWTADLEAEGLMVEPGAVLARGDTALAAGARGRVLAMLATAAALQGCMERALEITLDYMKSRVQFGRPIGAFQALQHRAVDLFIQQELSRAVLGEAAAAVADPADPDRALMEAARAKARATHAALLIGREAIKLHGAIAVTDEYDVGLYLRRILALAPRFGNAGAARATCCALMRTRGGPLQDDDAALPPPPPEFLSDDRQDIDWNRFDDASFRAGVRAVFEARYPAHLRNLGRRGAPGEMAEWLALMVRKGWIAPAWPVEHGGMGLEPGKQIIFIEERERAGIARNPDQGVVMFGPMLMRHGTEAQKARFLPGIVANRIIFCQGYSEPGAGSDLASLTTRARPHPGGFLVRGTKIWTTMAHHATHMFLLARSDPDAPRHAGISFLVLNLTTPGVTIRPIRNIAGHEEFCEVFLDDVFIPQENLIGALHDGWRVARSLLGFERLNNGSPRRVQGPLRALEALARARGLDRDPEYLAQHAAICLDIADLKSAYARFCDLVRAGGQPGPEVSQLKIWAGDCAQRLSEYLIALAGEDGGLREPLPLDAGQRVDVLAPFYAMFPAQIASGSSDVQRNILATRVLGLPKEPRPKEGRE